MQQRGFRRFGIESKITKIQNSLEHYKRKDLKQKAKAKAQTHQTNG